MMFDARPILYASFEAALDAARASTRVAPFLPETRARRVRVVGAGKAAAAMARAVEDAWPEISLEGLVITRYGHSLATRSIRVVEAGHPVPDEAGREAARAMLDMARSLDTDDLLVVLISGGASSLMTLPAEGLSLEDLREVNRELLRSGAPVEAMNVVRKHLSSISGGRLAEACRARVVALIISDVTGDDPTDIGSGPCAADPSTYHDALAISARYSLNLPRAAHERLRRGAAGEAAETPKPGSAIFARVENRIIATPHASLEAAARNLRAAGIACAILGDTVTGEAQHAARVFAALVREIRHHGQPWKMPIALITGGECTVTLPSQPSGPARGGRCTEFLLALALELGEKDGVFALACDTDGVDGSEDNAGALITPDTLARARHAGLEGRELLVRHDAWAFFDALGDLVVTGPTLTNVNDYRVILVTES